MRKYFLMVLATCFAVPAAAAGAKLRPMRKLDVTVDAAGYHRVDAVASLDLTAYGWGEGQTPIVREVTGGGAKPCVSQFDNRDGKKTLYWRVDGDMEPQAVRSFVVEAAPLPASAETAMTIAKDKAGNLTLVRNGSPILTYNVQMKKTPHGVDPAFSRNGYIHPAWSPAGMALTNANPPDHVHHYGIWNPWTSVDYAGGHYDLWNLGGKTGTVLLDSVVSARTGDLFAELLVRHHHIIFQPQQERTYVEVGEIIKITPKKRIVIMDELLGMRAWNAGDGMFVWDFASDLIPATGEPVVLKAYRYAGFGWRATPEWTNENARMLTSEGLERDRIDGTRARWIYAEGSGVKDGRSGFVVMSYPENREHPEPLRIWNSKANRGRGDVFVNFAPSKDVDWTLEPGGRYRLRYRIVTFDGTLPAAGIDRMWNDFAHPVKVAVK